MVLYTSTGRYRLPGKRNDTVLKYEVISILQFSGSEYTYCLSGSEALKSEDPDLVLYSSFNRFRNSSLVVSFNSDSCSIG